jgi:pseudouridylate synthase / pseudouridine kinase
LCCSIIVRHTLRLNAYADDHYESEPTSVVKSTSILPAIASCLDSGTAPITYASPNILELSYLYQAARSEPHDLMSHSTWWSSIDSFSLTSTYRMDLEQLAKRMVCDEDSSKGTLAFLIDQGISQMAVNLLPFFQHLIIKCGDRGVLVAMHITRPSTWSHERSNIFERYIVVQGSSGSIVLQHFPAHLVRDIVNVTGAGDSFVGALLALITQRPDTFGDRRLLAKAIAASQEAAKLTLQSHLSVSPTISYHSIMKDH